MIPLNLPAAGLAALLLLGAAGPGAADQRIAHAVEEARAGLGARIGIAVLDASGTQIYAENADERFPLNSTFKSFLCGAALRRQAEGSLDLEARVVVRPADLVTYSPVTEGRTGGDGMSLRALCEATLRTSDNTAANLVLDALGGPAAVTDFMRSLGDDRTRLDQRETALNQNAPDDPRDTTTPRAAAQSLGALLLGDTLTPQARETLEGWMAANEVAGPLLRAELPAGWSIADRSGAGANGSRSLIAKIEPADGEPVLVAIYLTETDADMDRRNAAIAAIGKAIFTTLRN